MRVFILQFSAHNYAGKICHGEIGMPQDQQTEVAGDPFGCVLRFDFKWPGIDAISTNKVLAFKSGNEEKTEGDLFAPLMK